MARSIFDRYEKHAGKHSHIAGVHWTGLVLLLFGLFAWSYAYQPPIRIPIAPPRMELRWGQMIGALNEMISTHSGEVGLYIKDLKTGQSFEYNADTRFVSASLIKLPIMVATCEAIRTGKLSLNTPLRYRRQYRRAGSGEMKWVRVGTVFPLSTLLYAMITHSDNTATAMVVDRLGYDYLNQSFEKFGMKETRIHPMGMSLANRVDPTRDNYTTPREMGVLLEKIYRHELVGDGLSDFMLEVMKRANSPSRLAKNLPHDWALARKTGLLRKNCHDVGIVYAPSGDYVICVLTSRSQSYKVAKGFIANVGRRAYAILRT